MAKTFKTEQRISTVLGAAESANATAQELKDQLEQWYDNMPEGIQNGSKGEELQEAISSLDEVIDSLNNLENYDSENPLLQYEYSYNQVIFMKSVYMSRQKRMEEAACALLGAPTEIPDELQGEIAYQDDMEEIINELSTATDALEGLEFPTR